jgi:hypothetical protein
MISHETDAAVQSDDYEGTAELYTRAIAAAVAAADGSMDTSLYTSRARCYANMFATKSAIAALATDPLGL